MRIQLLAFASVLALPLWFACASPDGSGADGEGIDVHRGGAPELPPDPDLDPIARGIRLYDTHCAVCHGDFGDGDGPASPYLFPRPRDFSKGRFRLVRTNNGVPTREDLVATLRRGVPGSAMPGWNWMEGEDLDALAALVRNLAMDGMAFELFLDGLSEEEAVAEARARTQPGEVLPEVAAVEATEAVLAEGRALYLANCASCHEADGTGTKEPRFDEWGDLNWPRDFTAGYLKGDCSATALGWRIQSGVPGSAMPATELEEDELAALVAYLSSEIPASVATNLVHTRENVRARRVVVVPSGPDDPAWELQTESPIVLAPLYESRPGRGITRAFVSARHDGERLALRVRWLDETGNMRIFSDLGGPDACALQFSPDEHPPLFGMGSGEHRTNLWHWKALRTSEEGGGLDLLDTVPHVTARAFRGRDGRPGRVRTDVPLYRPARSLPSVSDTVDSLSAEGIGQVEHESGGAPIAVEPIWEDGEWSVVFTRALAPRTGDEIDLRPGRTCSVSLAIWNGAAADRGARKSISIWQRLELDP